MGAALQKTSPSTPQKKYTPAQLIWLNFAGQLTVYEEVTDLGAYPIYPIRGSGERGKGLGREREVSLNVRKI